ncbi:SDR family oxidoreductase [Halobacillus locisalis]|uniref:SDR family oxidoreductase n=1 Tax=Halobacillus locisalis TaxID=220753 RepID=A0A838CQP9_9BACI|nr:SDR family oxidoreductase [Halobacillus locisalis]MBA2174387.1 SDR family oxidoreductase [Halobacillus locisalis]
MKMTNDTVLITGASNGIGYGLALAYAESGATVLACDKDQDGGEQLTKEIHDMGGRCFFHYCDVANPSSIKRLFQWIADHNHSFTILINNAGTSEFTNLFEMDVENWDLIMNTNLRSAFLFSKQAGAVWKENNQKGRIINIASTRAFMSEPNSEGYAASKGGMIALTHAMATSLSPYSIRVNSISPGWIHTGDHDKLREVDHQQHLSNRVGHANDVVKAAFFLSDKDNDFVTGENITVDGGMTRKMIYEH